MFKKGDTVVVVDAQGNVDSYVGQVLTVGHKFDECFYFKEVEFGLWPCRLKLYKEEPKMFDYSNTKINVQKYADTYGITLQQAHEEIQPLLFARGLIWGCDKKNNVSYTTSSLLFCNSWCDNLLTHTDDEYHFDKHRFPEITFSRVQAAPVLTPSFVEAEREIVELGGKKYYKEDLAKALENIKEIG